MNTYEILKNAHSGWRYIVIILLFVAIIQALLGWTGDKPYTSRHRKLNVFTLISAHIQLLFGLVLYFLSPLTKLPAADAIGRYWKMEHVSLMILAVILITIGNAQSKKITDEKGKHRTIAVYFGLAFLLIVGAIFMMIMADPSRTWY
ncbi:cytochrome B [Pedobacter sp. Du54]|uniref:cytochrome B n=1 Tax=Pedobacter anseongensis TaxID=3133439 RepID=UPI00309ECCD3